MVNRIQVPLGGSIAFENHRKMVHGSAVDEWERVVQMMMIRVTNQFYTLVMYSKFNIK